MDLLMLEIEHCQTAAENALQKHIQAFFKTLIETIAIILYTHLLN